MTILLLDCYTEGDGAARNFLPDWEGRDVRVVRTVHEPIPSDPAEFASIVVSGSAASVVYDVPAWVAPLEELLRRAVSARVPTLGVCFGHQALASALHGRDAVFRRDRLELGWVEIGVDEGSPLFDGLGGGFRAFETHFDDVRPDLPGVRVVARSASCPVQAIAIDGAPAWGVQFHPEMRLPEATALVRKRGAAVPDQIPDPEALLVDAVDTQALLTTLLANFDRAVAAGS